MRPKDISLTNGFQNVVRKTERGIDLLP